jgi:cytochrome c oxidase assembly protein subunit 15
MNGAFVPADVFAGGPRSAFEDPLTAHFDHRLLALVVTLAAIAFVVISANTPLRRRALFLLSVVALQITLGALTVILHVPIAIAVAHQLGGLFVFASALAVARGCRARTADLHHSDLVIRAGSTKGWRLQD